MRPSMSFKISKPDIASTIALPGSPSLLSLLKNDQEKFGAWKTKNLKNLVTQKFEFAGFMVFKMTVSDSGVTSFLWFSKPCTWAGEINKTQVKNELKNGSKIQISQCVLHSFENRKKLVHREYETVVWNIINPMNSNFCVTRFFRFFVFQA